MTRAGFPPILGLLGLCLVGALLLAAWQVRSQTPHLLFQRGPSGWQIAEIYRSAGRCAAQLRRVVGKDQGAQLQCVRVGERLA